MKQSTLNELRDVLNKTYRLDEALALKHLLEHIHFSDEAKVHISNRAYNLVAGIRQHQQNKKGFEAFLQHYNLSSEQGIALMCLAEALLRIPDEATASKFISDKLSQVNWKANLGKSQSLFVNATTWALVLTSKIMSKRQSSPSNLLLSLKNFTNQSSKFVVKKAIREAMKILGQQFVLGENIESALKRASKMEAKGYLYSYDMLGEAARTAEDAEKYFRAYETAISHIVKRAHSKNCQENPGISVKLSALYPRYEYNQHDAAASVVQARLLALALRAKEGNINLFVDAEEADRLDLSLDIIEQVFCNPALAPWEGFGLAVQSYQKRAWYLIDWLAQLAYSQKRRLMVRLIKGAYWDAEIKTSQEKGLEGYPVFTRKAATDVSFLACAKKILAHPDAFYAAFATHNAHSVAAILEMAGSRKDFEFQCLHGMGQALYTQIVEGTNAYACRIYAPVGCHEDLLPYLVRRLLENGANSSFVNRIVDAKTPIEEIIMDPIEKLNNYQVKQHPKIPLPTNLFGPERKNSQGIDFSNKHQLQELIQQIQNSIRNDWVAMPTSQMVYEKGHAIYDPSDRAKVLGYARDANNEEIELALKNAEEISASWSNMPVAQRADYLDKAATLFEMHYPELMALAIREAGKTMGDALSEIREAIDFCRYYAAQARNLLKPIEFKGPTGEDNWMQFHGRGPFVCISPWNFPLAIFIGQIAAALVTGNPVLAKPAEQTPLMAALAVKLLHEAGIPKAVLQLLPGKGEEVGARLVADKRVKGVVFTGSTATARIINQILANREGSIIPLIAETGGQNALIVDSSALPEQVVMDTIHSAFNSAGQRCSALRVLYVQEEIADKVITMIKGAMAELHVDDPGLITTDIGPVIDADAKAMLETHAAKMDEKAQLIYKVPLTENTQKGTFFAPRAYEIKDIKELCGEVFGPVLHVIRYKTADLNKIIQAINDTGYGLTLGIHSRITETIDHIRNHLQVGNCYVNRNMIGAVVGVQPFGGEGLSGTGPKAGGPNYLYRFCTERSVSINTTAAGGNASLMCLQEN